MVVHDAGIAGGRRQRRRAPGRDPAVRRHRLLEMAAGDAEQPRVTAVGRCKRGHHLVARAAERPAEAAAAGPETPHAPGGLALRGREQDHERHGRT